MWILINICSDPSLSWERLIILHHNFSCGIQRLRRKMLAAHSNFPFVGSGWELKISRMRFVHDERSENVCGEQCFCYSSLEQMSYLRLCKMSWWRLVMVYAAQLRVLMGILDAVKWKRLHGNIRLRWHTWQCTLRFQKQWHFIICYCCRSSPSSKTHFCENIST